MKFAILMIAAISGAAFAGTVSDATLGYAVTLPPHWVQLKTKPDQHYFRDSSKQYHSQISILKYAIDGSTYPSARTWTEAQFIAYKLSVETSTYPFGAIAYYDSTSAAVLGSEWAPEAFSVLYPADGDPTYCEFMRYCAVGNTGYEIYAIGDSTDMIANVDFYAAIIATMRFTPTEGIIAPLPRQNPARVAGPLFAAFDLNGREIPLFPPGIRSLGKQRFVVKTAP
ncbi:MAG: hypothetical protein ABI036_02290 [Fibrobacteria bacterium]